MTSETAEQHGARDRCAHFWHPDYRRQTGSSDIGVRSYRCSLVPASLPSVCLLDRVALRTSKDQHSIRRLANNAPGSNGLSRWPVDCARSQDAGGRGPALLLDGCSGRWRPKRGRRTSVDIVHRRCVTVSPSVGRRPSADQVPLTTPAAKNLHESLVMHRSPPSHAPLILVANPHPVALRPTDFEQNPQRRTDEVAD